MYGTLRNTRSLVLLAMLFIVPAASSEGEQEARVVQYVLAQINSQLDIEVKAVDGAIQSEVFSCKFFQAKPWLKNPDGSKESWSKYLLTTNGSEVASISKPSTLEGNQDLVNCVNDGFAVVTEADAIVLMNALEGVFSKDSSSFERRVSRSNNGWRLITDAFFEDFSGYFVQTDGNGKVTNIGHSLELMTL